MRPEYHRVSLYGIIFSLLNVNSRIAEMFCHSRVLCTISGHGVMNKFICAYIVKATLALFRRMTVFLKNEWVLLQYVQFSFVNEPSLPAELFPYERNADLS